MSEARAPARTAPASDTLSIPATEIGRRTQSVRERLATAGVECLVAHAPSNIHYLSGFETVSTGTYACHIVSAGVDPTLLIWQLEEAGARRTSPIGGIVTYPTGEDPVEATVRAVERHAGQGRIALELDAPSLSPRAYAAILARFGAERLVDAGPLIADVRRVKSAFEIACFRTAAGMTDTAMSAAIEAVREGASDNNVAAAAAAAMYEAGSEYSSMPPIVSAGPQSGIAHSTFKNLTLRRGDAVLMELGACSHRYCTPLMRTVAVGEPTPAARDLYLAAHAVLARALTEIRPGRTADDVASAIWGSMPGAIPDLVFHGVFGYAVGSGFPPSWAEGSMRIRRGNPQPVLAGMVLHLPIAFRRPGVVGVAISETIVVGADGVEVLGKVPRELPIR